MELPNPKHLHTINRADYMSTRPGQIDRKAASMNNGIANAQNGGMVGDGARFRGRGFLQITGRKNYTGYGTYRGKDFTAGENSELLASIDFNACDASGFYWAREKGKKVADNGVTPEDVTHVSGLINRGSSHKTPANNPDRHNVFNYIWKALNEK